MEKAAISVVEYLWAQSLQLAVLVAVVSVMSLLLKRKSAHIRYLLWLILLVKCVIPPFFSVALKVYPPEPKIITSSSSISENTPASQKTLIPASYLSQFSSDSDVIEKPKSSLLKEWSEVSFYSWLTIAWYIGLILFLFIAIKKIVHTNRWIRRSRRKLPPELNKEVAEMLVGLRIKSRPKFWSMSGLHEPIVWGFPRGSIYLPSHFHKCLKFENRYSVLTHELYHCLRYDALVNFVQIIIQSIFWFNPLVWLANRKIRSEREKCCDEAAIARLKISPERYGEAVIEALESKQQMNQPVPEMAITGRIKNLTERIMTIMGPGKKFYQRPSIVTMMISILFALLVIPTSMAFIKRSPSNITIAEIDFDPIHQGKNFVFIQAQNTSSREQILIINVYTRSPDIGHNGIGWGRDFVELLASNEMKQMKFPFDIQGPVTQNTYIRLLFYNPDNIENRKKKNYFEMRKYRSVDVTNLGLESRKEFKSASENLYEEILTVFNNFQKLIQDRQYEKAWGYFSEDFKSVKYVKIGLSKFIGDMEGTLPANYLWSREHFLELKPDDVLIGESKLVLVAKYRSQVWEIDYIRSGGQWKIDWVSGYTPGVLLDR
jgi:beta-lactamase regulating signal transducer with metallopeptidase domain